MLVGVGVGFFIGVIFVRGGVRKGEVGFSFGFVDFRMFVECLCGDVY